MNTLDPSDTGPQRTLPPRLDPRAGRPTRPVDAAPSRRSRSGLAITGRVLGATLSVLLLAGSGWGWYLGRVAEASVTRTDAIPTGNGARPDGSAMNLLLVGDDTRADLSPAQMAQFNAGNDGGSQNTDTMMLLHVPADGSRASFVSLPRDSYVQIPGFGWDKLNAAYSDGYTSAPKGAPEAARQAAGQQLLVQTVSRLTGQQIDHYVSVDLLGFFNLSNVVGGVQVNLCKAVSDSYSGAHFPAGVQTISGADALKFVRQRHGLPRGDLDRVVRQQVFIAGVARKILDQNVMLNPSKQHELVQAVGQSLTVDQSLDLMQLAGQMQKVTAGGVNFQTMPIAGDAKDPAGRDILKLPPVDTLRQWFAALSDDAPAPSSAPSPAPAPQAPATVAPGKVKVAVFNGSGRRGLAAGAATGLQAAGFVISGTGNADSSNHTTTEIRYAAGDAALAATLAAAIPGATTTEISGATPGTVQLILGSDFTAVGQPVTATATTPTTAALTPSEAPRTAADTSCIN